MDTKIIQNLRKQTGAGIVDCKKALQEADENLDKAIEILRRKGKKMAEKKQDRAMLNGLIESYVHAGGKVGAIIELSCETDFVARNKEFKNLAHDLAMQVAATNPSYLKPEDIPQDVIEKEKSIYKDQIDLTNKPADILDKIIEGKLQKYFQEVCLLKQPFIKDDKMTVEELIKQKVAQIGENISLRRFVRFSL